MTINKSCIFSGTFLLFSFYAFCAVKLFFLFFKKNSGASPRVQPLPQEEVPEDGQEGAEVQAGQGVPKVLPDKERREFLQLIRYAGNGGANLNRISFTLLVSNFVFSFPYLDVDFKEKISHPHLSRKSSTLTNSKGKGKRCQLLQ